MVCYDSLIDSLSEARVMLWLVQLVVHLDCTVALWTGHGIIRHARHNPFTWPHQEQLPDACIVLMSHSVCCTADQQLRSSCAAFILASSGLKNSGAHV